MRLLVIDGNSIANRAFFGIKLLTTKDGRYTNAIYGFLNILLSLLKECEPDEVAVAFDLKAPTFRHKMYDGYKATRHGMPEELAQQMPVLKELLADLGYRTVTAEGWEADDILGTLAAACAARKDDCFLATGDRDSLQLVSDTTTVLLAATVMGRSKTVTMDVDAIQEKYGIQPRQLIEVKSLMGDASDNIPGVKGIGEKTALTLVQNFGTLEGVYEHIDDKLIKPKQREHLLECREMAQLSHTLGTIRTDAPIDTAEGTYAVGEGNKAEAVRLLQELEIHSLIPRFGLDGIAPAAPEEEDGIELAEAELEALPLAPSGTYLVASRPAVMGKQGTRNVVLQPESWYAVQDCTVYPLEDADLVRLLDNADVTLEVFNAAPLYAKAMAAGGWGSSIVWDGKLAAYLLDASASKYQISELTASYRAAAAFTCADYPDAAKVLIGSFQKNFNFFQNSVLSLAYRGLFDVHNLRDLTLCFSVLISQCQQELLVGRQLCNRFLEFLVFNLIDPSKHIFLCVETFHIFVFPVYREEINKIVIKASGCLFRQFVQRAMQIVVLCIFLLLFFSLTSNIAIEIVFRIADFLRFCSAP